MASKEGDPKDVLFADDAGHFGSEPWGGTARAACGFYWTEGVRGLGWGGMAIPTLKGGSTVGVPSPPAMLLPGGRIITPSIEDAERLQGFRKGWTKPAERIAKPGFRWRLVGNAVSVPVARWVGECLARPGKAEPTCTREVSTGEPLPDAAWNDGTAMLSAAISKWPKRPRKQSSLASFLTGQSRLLSPRATAGFYLRATERSKLKFPPGFLDAVAHHLEAMGGAPKR